MSGIEDISKKSVNESKWSAIVADHENSIDLLLCVEHGRQEDEQHLVHLKTSPVEMKDTAIGRLIREE